MVMVEGVGDEVVQALVVCLVVLIVVTAWRSTAIRELPQIRAVFIVDRRTRVPGEAVGPPDAAVPPDPGPQAPQTSTPGDSSESDKPTGSGQGNEINAFRLSYFTNLQSQSTPGASTSADSAAGDHTATDTVGDQPAPQEPAPQPHNPIRIKLKYLNDEQKIVTADLKELLGSFKRRYFQVELSNNKNVLLIFQGKVLKEDESLETIGMYDNCVVHCLIKAGRPPAERNDTARPNNTTDVNNLQPADWNLGPVLLATLVAMFSLAWFSYWTYPQLFGITSTVLLATLTTLFLFAVASLYYPNLFQSF